MKTLVSTAEVLQRAFKSHEKLPHDTIREADVEAVEWRRLRPVLGAALHDRLLQGDDVAFVQRNTPKNAATITEAQLYYKGLCNVCSAKRQN